MKTTRNRFITEQPFTEEQVMYRFVPTPEADDQPGTHWDLAQEYVVIADPNALHGIVVYARHAPGWLAYPSGSLALLAHVLTERTTLLAMCAERQRLLSEWETLSTKQLVATIQDKETIADLKAQLECYQDERGSLHGKKQIAP